MKPLLWRIRHVVKGAGLFPFLMVFALSIFSLNPGLSSATSSSVSQLVSTSSTVAANPLQYPCTVNSPSCNSVGTTTGFYNGNTVNFLYTQQFYCDTSVSSQAPSGCEAGAPANNLPPGVSSAQFTDPLYIPVPLGFTPTQQLQCPANVNCIDHPNNIDLSRIAAALPGNPSPSSVADAMLPGHDHVVATANSNQPEWWPVVVVPVTTQAAFTAITTAKSYSEIQTLQAQANSGVGQDVATNAYLYFQVLPGVVPSTQPQFSSAVPPSSTNPNGTTFTNLVNNCTNGAPGSCDNVGVTSDWLNGQNVQALYTQEYFCDTSVSSQAASGCEVGAPAKNLPPGVSSAQFTDPLYIPVPLFSPGPSYLQCAAGVPCIDHPTSIDLTRIASALGVSPSAVANAMLPGHDHIITTRNGNKPEWWPVVVIGVTNPGSFKLIEQAKSLAEVRLLQSIPNSGVTPDIPTNVSLFFQTLPGTGPQTPPPAQTTAGCSATLSPGSVVATASTPDGGGYWAVSATGQVAAFGDAACYGSLSNVTLNKPIVGIAADPQTGGYWLVASDGGVFSFNAPFEGSMGGKPLNKPIVGITADAQTGGYWMVASDGGVFSFNAPFEGSAT